jgi:Cu+-exporting ATPase
MPLTEIAVTIAGLALIAVLARYFFQDRPATDAQMGALGQEATVVVLGGYQPAVVRARTGAPLRLTFDRREDGDCSARVVIPDLGVNRFLAPFASTTVDVSTDRPGTFDFACGMNMIHGQLVVGGEPAESGRGDRHRGPRR